MIGISQLFFCFYLAVLLFWILRAGRALGTLMHAPWLTRRPAPEEAPHAAVIVPAKNEEKNIGACLESLLAQDYPCFEILVINDNSSDGTEAILREFQSAHTGSSPALRIVKASATPSGWTGKNWAIHEGVREVEADWYLFTDADTRHDPGSLSSALSYAREQKLQLLTLTPRCLAEGFYEKTIQPPAMGFTGLWFPPEEVNNPHKKACFGNGQYLLIERELYKAIGGHEAVCGEFLEDFALFRKSKELGRKVCCAIGTRVYGTRMYDSLGAIWKGWRRIYLHAFERRTGRLLQKAFSVFFLSALPFFGFAALSLLVLDDRAAYGVTWLLALAVLAVILGTVWKTHGIVRAPRRYAALHPFAALILTGVLLNAAWMAWTKKQTVWR